MKFVLDIIGIWKLNWWWFVMSCQIMIATLILGDVYNVESGSSVCLENIGFCLMLKKITTFCTEIIHNSRKDKVQIVLDFLDILQEQQLWKQYAREGMQG